MGAHPPRWRNAMDIQGRARLALGRVRRIWRAGLSAHSDFLTREEWDAFRVVPENWPDARAITRGVCAIMRSGLIPCAICGSGEYVVGDEYLRATVDHVIEKRDGGDNWPGNLQPAHRLCNVRKGNAAKRARGGKPYHPRRRNAA